MKIKQKFHIYNFILLAAPIFLIGVVSLLFLIIFIAKFPADTLYISRASLINPQILVRAIGAFFSTYPSAVTYLVIYITLCISICVATNLIVTRHLSSSLEKPIKNLQKDMDRIRNGDLTFDVMSSDYEELDELCEGFDSMRRSLLLSREKEKKLKHERDMLITNISHDLKTPVTSIKGYIDGINDGIADTPEKLSRYLSTIKQKAQTIDSLVSNLSTFAQLEAEGLSFNKITGDLRDLVSDVSDSYSIDFENNGIDFELKMSNTPLYVNIDGEKMRRVLTNLIDNSIKYRQSDSKKIILTCFADERNAYITVEDDGIGIEQNEIKRVFDSFYRTDHSRSSHIKGNGLGLGIARQITEQHNGQLWLRSDGRNKGTTATISLPLTEKGGYGIEYKENTDN